MRTIACPACSEIIPDDVDFCPHCGESTKQVAVSLMTDEDREVAERMSAIAAANTSGANASTSSDPALRLPPASGDPVCMMCKIEIPPDGQDYCNECQEKLELRPEQWQIMKQEAVRRNAMMAILAVLALIAAGMLISMTIHHKRTAMLPASLNSPVMYSSSGGFASDFCPTRTAAA